MDIPSTFRAPRPKVPGTGSVAYPELSASEPGMDGERHCGVTRNINQHTRTETQWSGAAVTKKDVVCEKIFFTSGAGGKAFKDLGDIDSEATVQTTWSPEGFQLTRTIKKVENFKTNCRGDCSPTPTTQITAPSSKNLQSPKGLQSPVCEAVEIKPFKPLCHHPQDPDHACSPGTAYRSPLGFGFGSCVLASMNHVRKAHTWTLCVSCPRQVQPPHRTVSYAFRSRCADCPPSPLNPADLNFFFFFFFFGGGGGGAYKRAEELYLIDARAANYQYIVHLEILYFFHTLELTKDLLVEWIRDSRNPVLQILSTLVDQPSAHREASTGEVDSSRRASIRESLGETRKPVRLLISQMLVEYIADQRADY
ncbi:unnamed protein product [Bemisia tabaci]|uniref:Uncharacterized protein n=1 Tax=Bemisia tabaci TaxID=7038 RepID=A0A9P0AM61_BEMTA|nr:unnamed protein product [Bemisia tabaci]